MLPAYRLGWRAYAAGIRRFASRVRRQHTASLDHHAQAAEAEHLDLGRRAGDHLLDLRQRQNARQHCAFDMETPVIEIDCFVVGGRALHRQMQTQLRMGGRGVLHQPGIGDDHRIDFELRCAVDRALRALPRGELWVGVEREQHLPLAAVSVAYTFARAGRVEIEPGEVARVGVVAKADVNAVRAVIDGGLECGQTARRTHEIHAGNTL